MRIRISESTRSRKNSILGAEDDFQTDDIHDEKQPYFTGIGTTFYTISVERLLKAIDKSNKKINKFFADIIRYTDFDCINIDDMYGSSIDKVNDVMYLCVSDGKPIKVDGKEIDPQEALNEYTIEQLSEYTEEPSDDLILKYFTVYELNPDVFDSETIDTIVEDNLKKGVHFKDIVKDYDELKRILNIQ